MQSGEEANCYEHSSRRGHISISSLQKVQPTDPRSASEESFSYTTTAAALTAATVPPQPHGAGALHADRAMLPVQATAVQS